MATAALGLTLGVAGPALADDRSTIWGIDVPDQAHHEEDDQSVELGIRFTAEIDGAATAVRFYKVTQGGGTFTGALWSASGQKLAHATFVASHGTGWQTANLDNPVALTAGATYVASYRAPAGAGFAVTRYFEGDSYGDELSIPSRNAGVYTYSSPGTFPSTTWRSSQYWVDVVFTATGATTPEPTATSNPIPTTTPAPSPEPSPTAAPPTPTPTPTPAPTPPAATNFPTQASTGVPAGWQPTRQITGDHTVWEEGEVLENVRITGGILYVRAPNVTIRNVELVSARIINEYGGSCFSGLKIENSTIKRGSQDVWQPVIQSGGYTATGVELDGVSEGFRVGGKDVDCGPVVIQNSWAQIEPAQGCDGPGVDWHGDGLQGYFGVELTLRNSTILMGRTDYCQGTAAFFYPDQNNTTAVIENVLVAGGGYVFRLGTPGSVSGLKVVDDSWEFGPVDIADCSQVAWGSGNEIVRVDANGSLTSVAPLRCEGW